MCGKGGVGMDEPKEQKAKKKRKSESRTTLRLPPELEALIKAEAEKQHRSRHNLMLSILWDYFS